jgi:hypothetical protein
VVVTAATFYGGVRAVTGSFETHISSQHERLFLFDPGATPWAVRLSSGLLHKQGALAHVVANTSGANTLTVKDKSGSTLTTIAPGALRKFWLRDNSTVAGTWIFGPAKTFHRAASAAVTGITFGDGSTLVYTLTHGLGTKNLLWGIWETGSPYGARGATVEAISTTQVRVTVATAPGANALRIVLATTALAASLVGVDFGDGASTSLSVTHSLGSRDIVAQVRETAGDAPFVFPTVEAATTATAGVTALVAPGSNALRLIAALADATVTFGDTSTLVYVLTHSLGTRDIVAAVRLAASPYTFVAATIEATDTNTVTVTVATPPGTNALKLHVIG